MSSTWRSSDDVSIFIPIPKRSGISVDIRRLSAGERMVRAKANSATLNRFRALQRYCGGARQPLYRWFGVRFSMKAAPRLWGPPHGGRDVGGGDHRTVRPTGTFQSAPT